MEKAARTMKEGGTVVGVLPFRSDTEWFSEVMKAAEIRVVKGRLHYGDGKAAAPFPSCVAVWRPHVADMPRLGYVDRDGHPVRP